MLNSSNDDRSNIKIYIPITYCDLSREKSSSSQLRGTTFEIDQ